MPAASDKLTKKDLLSKIDELEKELYLYKNRTQLARNYSILQSEYDQLAMKKRASREDCAKKPSGGAEEEDEDEDSE